MSDPIAARRDDHHLCLQHVGANILPECAPTILIGSKPAARVTDLCKCEGGPVDIVQTGETDGSALYHLGRFLLDSDRPEFEKVLYGSQTAMLQINPETEEEESSTRRREDGFFRNRKNGQPSGTRVSVVLLLEEGTRLSNQGDCQEVEICHNAVAMHNPNAGVRVEIERFCNIPQYVFENGELSRINPKSAIEA